ncbi:RNA-directed DNA polymerase, eukaryota [Tanacetum coccineum]
MLSHRSFRDTVVWNFSYKNQFDRDVVEIFGNWGLTKHINVRYHFIREVLEAKTVKVLKVGTEHNAADALTKVVPGRKLQHCLELLKVGSASSNQGCRLSILHIRKVIDDKFLPNVSSKTRWVKYVPIKVNILAWKVKMEALPVRFNLSRRGIDIGSIVCPVCESEVETASHLFFKCSLLRQIARKVSSWWNVDYVGVNSYEEWLDWLGSLRLPAKLKLMLEGVFYVVWWYIWSHRLEAKVRSVGTNGLRILI